LIVVVVITVTTHQLLRLRKLYNQNGGQVLEGVKNIRIYTRTKLKKITNNYKHVIGEGHFGKVYKGIIDKQEVAVKKSIKVDKEMRKEFIDEVQIQSRMRHKNIVLLLGCCLQMEVPLLVYEFAVKGSLYDVLFKDRNKYIPVDTRLRIALGSAEGLAYMHSAVENTIRHGDVKSANILLDENFTPKVADFGTSKLLVRGKAEKADLVIGDMAYIDPEYMANGTVTQKSDVYSFGIVLIELITRRRATYDEKKSYVANFVQASMDKRARELFDNDVTSEMDIGLLEMVSEIVVKCVKPKPEERLEMKQVEHHLNKIIGQSA
jgi:serine/threonine protein kinase